MKTLKQHKITKMHGGIGHYKDVTGEEEDLSGGYKLYGGIGHQKQPTEKELGLHKGADHFKIDEGITQLPDVDPKLRPKGKFLDTIPHRQFEHKQSKEKNGYNNFELDKLEHSLDQHKELSEKHHIAGEIYDGWSSNKPDPKDINPVKQAFFDYTGNGYSELNRALWNGTKLNPNSQRIHDGLKEGFKNSPKLEKPLKTFSGIAKVLGQKMAQNLEKSKGVVHFPAYMSSSINPQTALDFSEDNTRGKDVEHHIVKFHLPAGYKNGHYVDSFSDHNGEQEYLLNHNQKFKVIGHDVHTASRTDWNDRPYKKICHVWHVQPA